MPTKKNRTEYMRHWRWKNRAKVNASVARYDAKRTQRQADNIDILLKTLHRYAKYRVEGKTTIKKPHLYLGLELCSYEDFYSWAIADKTLHKLYKAWKKSKLQRNLKPTINRKDSAKGYTLDNMEWMTRSDNCRDGGRAKKETYKKDKKSDSKVLALLEAKNKAEQEALQKEK